MRAAIAAGMITLATCSAGDAEWAVVRHGAIGSPEWAYTVTHKPCGIVSTLPMADWPWGIGVFDDGEHPPHVKPNSMVCDQCDSRGK
jgi:hypothetical protein